MLSQIDLSKSLDKKEYKASIEALEEKLEQLQLRIRDEGIPIIVLFEGWGASGKGTQIARAVYPLDPRYFSVCTMDKVTEDMTMRPFLWAFWNKIPAKGRIAFFDKSWYRLNLPDVKERWKLHELDEINYYRDVNAFERQLTDDGVLIIKFFLHISQEEQRSRFKELEKNPDTAWRVRLNDWEQNKDYQGYVKRFEKMIKATDSETSPWQIIESDDFKFAVVKVFKTIISSVENRLENKTSRSEAKPQTEMIAPILRNIDANQDISDGKYKKELANYQEKISELGYKLYTKRRPVIIVYEGWDAAGKGGNIKRLTEELDPRSYEVVPISVPSAEEKDHHYLWRFYKKFPKDGHITIFDRSWYGRVLVERVEGFAAPEVWKRAYEEINEMESHLYDHGAIILKFWLHIDPDEQLKRFHDRQTDPLKQYKITYDDWRNRDKWPAYELAADEMLTKTNKDYAPWIIVEANSKKFARIKVLKTVVNALEKALD